MVANLHFQLSWYNQITLLPPPTQHHSFFRNFHPFFKPKLRGIAEWDWGERQMQGEKQTEKVRNF